MTIPGCSTCGDGNDAKGGKAGTPPPPPPGVMTAAQAAATFKDLAAKKDIPFDYPVDCCYTRAHVMCRDIEGKGFSCQKVWYFADGWGTPGVTPALHPVKPDGSPVTFPNPATGKEQPVQWVYHVAPVVKVQGADGKINEMVMDPSVAKGPISKADWEKIQGTPKGAYEEMSDSGAYFSNKKNGIRQEDPDLSVSKKQLAKHRMDRDAARAAAAKTK